MNLVGESQNSLENAGNDDYGQVLAELEDIRDKVKKRNEKVKEGIANKEEE